MKKEHRLLGTEAVSISLRRFSEQMLRQITEKHTSPLMKQSECIEHTARFHHHGTPWQFPWRPVRKGECADIRTVIKLPTTGRKSFRIVAITQTIGRSAAEYSRRRRMTPRGTPLTVV